MSAPVPPQGARRARTVPYELDVRVRLKVLADRVQLHALAADRPVRQLGGHPPMAHREALSHVLSLPEGLLSGNRLDEAAKTLIRDAAKKGVSLEL